MVLARNNHSSTSLILRDINATDSIITRAPEGTMNHSGSIAFTNLSGEDVSGWYLYIPGTDIYSRVNNDGSAELNDVPPGTFSTIMLAFNSNAKRNVLRQELTLSVGDTATVELPLWQYSRTLRLNTTPAGANISGTVTFFPVLIRLNSSNFDFSQSRLSGNDLVFTGKNGKSLPCQIERWDAAAKRAELWVNVDTIFGNDSTQSITMYWGNSSATAEKNIVFDTAAGYQGVWHFEGTSDDPVKDATINQFDGDAPDSVRPRSGEGIIGNCRIFDGISNYLTMPNSAYGKLNIPQNRNYTVSAWAYLDTLDNQSHCVVSKGIEQYYIRSTYSSDTPVWEFVEYNSTVGVVAPTSPVVPRKWVFLVGVRQGNKQYLYCNGEAVDSITAAPPASTGSSLNDLFIGRFSKGLPVPANDGFSYFKGSIDEIRIMNIARNPDWIRLCYMNQRSDDRLVVFK